MGAKRDAGAPRWERDEPGVLVTEGGVYATSCMAACTCSVVMDFALAIAAAKRA